MCEELLVIGGRAEVGVAHTCARVAFMKRRLFRNEIGVLTYPATFPGLVNIDNLLNVEAIISKSNLS